MQTVAREPSATEIRASYRNTRNVRLARAVHPLLTHCSYDKHSAHRWVLRLIDADPKSGEDAAVALANYDWMIDGARASYRNARTEQRRYDAVFAAYRAWRDDTATREAA